MDPLDSVTSLAATKRRELLGSDESVDASVLLARALNSVQLKVQKVARDHPLLAGGLGSIYPNTQAIYVARSLPVNVATFVEAHELGHYWIEGLDSETIASTGVGIESAECVESVPSHCLRSHGSSARREQLANQFAREFLLPCLDYLCMLPSISNYLGDCLGLPHDMFLGYTDLPLRRPLATAICQSMPCWRQFTSIA